MDEWETIKAHYQRVIQAAYAQPVYSHHTRAAFEACEHLLSDLDLRNAVELGCGTAPVLDWLARRKVQTLGITLGKEPLAHEFLQRDFHFTGLPDASFDLVVMRHALEHSPMPLLALLEVARISRRWALIIVPCDHPYWINYPNHYSVFSDAGWRRLFAEAGFQVVRFERGSFAEGAPSDIDIEWRYLLEKTASVVHDDKTPLLSEAVRRWTQTQARAPQVSVITPTRDRAHLLNRYLEALSRQTVVPGTFEIIVIDDGSTDNTPQVLQSWEHCFGPFLKVIRQDSRGPAAARNAGINASRGKLIIFLDDDVIARESLVEAHLKAHEEFPGTEVAFLGQLVWPDEYLQVEPFMEYQSAAGTIMFDYPKFHDRQLLPFRHFITANLSIKKDFLGDERFDEHFPYAMMEDTELGYRLSQRGLQLRYCRDAVGLHDCRRTYWTFRNRQEQYGFSLGYLESRWGDLAQELGAASLLQLWSESGALLPSIENAIAELEKVSVRGLDARLQVNGHSLQQLIFRLRALLYATALNLHIARGYKRWQENRRSGNGNGLRGRAFALPSGEAQSGAIEKTQSELTPLLVPEAEDLMRLRQLRVALIYDNTVRPDTTGEYCRRALERACMVKHILPQYLNAVRPEDFDLFFHVDDGLNYLLPPHLKPSIWWVIDTHLQYEWDVLKARQFDAVFAAQRDGTARLRSDGVPAIWLPLAADPQVHHPVELPEKFDWCFVGNLTEHGNPIGLERAALIELLKKTFPNYYVGRAYGDDMCRVYSASRVVFNRSVRNDVNMRVFEALACGRPLLTNAIDQNGLPDLLIENKNYVAYRTADDLIEKLRMLLSDDGYRVNLGRSGREAVLAKHTYFHRMMAALSWLLKEEIVKPKGSSFLAIKPTVSRAFAASLSPLVSIVILTHNELSSTKQCLASIEAHTSQPYELLLVDNGSTDGTLDFLRAYAATRDHVRVITNADNRGFSAGNNQGLSLAKGDYVLLLNNDTIVTEGWLERMLAIFQRYPQTGIVGPMSNYVSGPQLVPNVSYKTLTEMESFAAQWAAEHAGQSTQVARVVGFCLLARREVIERIGGLDEQFGTGNFEDDDFCIRAALAGYEVRIAQDVFIHHTGSQTFRSAGIDYRQSMQRNWELFKAKWGIPADTPLEQGYRVPKELPDPSRLYVPLPDVSADHQLDTSGRWWEDVRLSELQATQEAVHQILAPGQAALERGDLEAAAREFAQVTQRYPDLAAGHTALGSTLMALGRPQEAIPALRRAAELVPQAASLQNQLGVALYQTGDLVGAEAAFQAARQLAPNDVPAALNLIDLYRTMGDYAQATAVVKDALRQHPDHSDVLAAFGTLCAELGDGEGVEMALRHIQARDPHHPAIASLQQVLLASDESGEAVETLPDTEEPA